MPENIRGQFVAQLMSLLPGSVKVFLLTIEDAADSATLKQALRRVKYKVYRLSGRYE